MDPNAVLHELASSIAYGDFEVAHECLCDLEEWIRKGGFWPTNIQLNTDRSITITKERAE
jgi:hypothetical protein